MRADILYNKRVCLDLAWRAYPFILLHGLDV